MPSEPKCSMKQVTTRVPLEDYARVIQLVDTAKREDGTPKYRDVSAFTRFAVHCLVRTVELDEQYSQWVDAERDRNISKRMRNRVRKGGFLKRMFGRK